MKLCRSSELLHQHHISFINACDWGMDLNLSLPFLLLTCEGYEREWARPTATSAADVGLQPSGHNLMLQTTREVQAAHDYTFSVEPREIFC